MVLAIRNLTYCVLAPACLTVAIGGAIRGDDAETIPSITFHEPRPWIDRRASTPFEGHARGLSAIIRSQAAYNLTTAEALQKLAEAAREQVRTREEWTHTYFQLREANRAYRDKEELPRPTPEEIVRYAQMGKPDRLSFQDIDPVTGTIQWPDVLQDAAFAEGRAQLESLFSDWVQYGSLRIESRQGIRNRTDAMLSKLRDRIEDVPPADYMAARRFLESLAYEAHLAAG